MPALARRKTANKRLHYRKLAKAYVDPDPRTKLSYTRNSPTEDDKSRRFSRTSVLSRRGLMMSACLTPLYMLGAVYQLLPA